MVLFVGKFEDSTSKKKEWEKYHNFKRKKGTNSLVRHVISPAESLNGVSIEKVMVSGDGRDVNGELGIWREKIKLVRVCPCR